MSKNTVRGKESTQKGIWSLGTKEVGPWVGPCGVNNSRQGVEFEGLVMMLSDRGRSSGSELLLFFTPWYSNERALQQVPGYRTHYYLQIERGANESRGTA